MGMITTFDSPTAVGAKPISITGTLTNANGGAASVRIPDERVTVAMRAIAIQYADPTVFHANVVVACNNGEVVISCDNVIGSSAVTVDIIKVVEDPTAVTSTEFDVLANRIHKLNQVTELNNNGTLAALKTALSGVADAMVTDGVKSRFVGFTCADSPFVSGVPVYGYLTLYNANYLGMICSDSKGNSYQIARYNDGTWAVDKIATDSQISALNDKFKWSDVTLTPSSQATLSNIVAKKCMNFAYVKFNVTIKTGGVGNLATFVTMDISVYETFSLLVGSGGAVGTRNIRFDGTNIANVSGTLPAGDYTVFAFLAIK